MKLFQKDVKGPDKFIEYDDIYWLVGRSEKEAKVKMLPFVYSDMWKKIVVLTDNQTFEIRDYKLMPQYKEFMQKYPSKPHFEDKEDERFYYDLSYKKQRVAEEEAKTELFTEVSKKYFGENYKLDFTFSVIYEPLPFKEFNYGVSYISVLSKFPYTFRKYIGMKFHSKTNSNLVSVDKLPEMVDMINKYETKQYQKVLKKNRKKSDMQIEEQENRVK